MAALILDAVELAVGAGIAGAAYYGLLSTTLRLLSWFEDR